MVVVTGLILLNGTTTNIGLPYKAVNTAITAVSCLNGSMAATTGVGYARLSKNENNLYTLLNSAQTYAALNLVYFTS
ncbi:hypothetical protein LJC51_09040 [Lachnospiraceae bacterium OttesenSCG-928-J05]|nr:hypothetical protein [Lachnospiraceae bacterium OttesenSCG-928-J05]